MTSKSVSLPYRSIIKASKSAPSIDFTHRHRGLLALFDAIGARRRCNQCAEEAFDFFENPERIYDQIEHLTDTPAQDVHLVGPLERRFAIVRRDLRNLGIVFGEYGHQHLPSCLLSRMTDIRYHSDYAFEFSTHGDDFYSYLSRPRIFLAALYHPEHFPLPRFSLAISDLARASRALGLSRITLRDMQLGVTVADLARDIRHSNPDLIGISATFGQHDVLEHLLDELGDVVHRTGQIVFGGSLSALNRRVLLERFPSACVATGLGEATMAGLIRMHRGEIQLSEVTGLAYCSSDGTIHQTPKLSPREIDDMLPELDLLDETLRSKGVVQLESSRGCSYACSFCPRSHKGIWSGDDATALEAVLPDIARLRARNPKIAPRIFLVDEEFIGYRADRQSEERVLNVARTLHEYGFRFETSSRVDQVFRRNRDGAWHAERIELWRQLVGLGLHRCLFGIESGIDAVLLRFNKKTDSFQNSVALRILSLIGVPPRYTYITFDPLMSKRDLFDTFHFQGRTDLLLCQCPHLSADEVLEIATNDTLSRDYTQGIPFYNQISYMLVSIECLQDAPYTEEVRRHGLLRSFNANMGRYDHSYLDPEIGLFSDCAQRWIDRNFSLDYLLKSIEKYTEAETQDMVRRLRLIIKRFAFELLELMVALVAPARMRGIGLCPPDQSNAQFIAWRDRFRNSDLENKRVVVYAIMDRHFAMMNAEIYGQFDEGAETLPRRERHRIARELDIWRGRREWIQINAS